MKRLLATAAALALVALHGAEVHAADVDSTEIDLFGEVGDTCTLDAGSQADARNAAFAAGQVQVFELADRAAMGLAFDVAINFAAMCNFVHSVALASLKNGMIVDAEPSRVAGLFDYRVNYIVTLNHSADQVCGGGLELATDGLLTDTTPAEKDESANVDAACAGTLTVGISALAGINPLLSGAYVDTLILTFGPQI